MGTEASRGGADSPRMPRGAEGGAWGWIHGVQAVCARVGGLQARMCPQDVYELTQAYGHGSLYIWHSRIA